jgi:hypothetical protein
VESELFGKQRQRLTQRYPRASSALEGLTFTISRGAEMFDEVPGKCSYKLARSQRTRGDEAGVPRLRVIFRILDEDRIELCAVTAVD